MKYGIYLKKGLEDALLIETFDDVAAARLKTRGLTGALSHGEKKYFGMKYTVRIIRD